MITIKIHNLFNWSIGVPPPINCLVNICRLSLIEVGSVMRVSILDWNIVLIKEPIIHTDKEFIATKINEDNSDKITKTL